MFRIYMELELEVELEPFRGAVPELLLPGTGLESIGARPPLPRSRYSSSSRYKVMRGLQMMRAGRSKSRNGLRPKSTCGMPKGQQNANEMLKPLILSFLSLILIYFKDL